MTEELDFETYLNISPNKIGIYLLDVKNLKNLYFEEINFNNKNYIFELSILKEFLDNNIFKIEKLTGKFIKNINLILENENILSFTICLKKKNYQKVLTKKFLENSLQELRDLFHENYYEYKIMHMLIISYLIDGNSFSKFKSDLDCKNLIIETQFISVPNSIILEIDKILGNYQINTTNYLNQKYIQSLFDDKKIELSEMAYKSKIGYNINEVILVPKNTKKTGFFEKFFQLFS